MIEYNTIVGGGNYEIRFKTDNKESYREIEKHIQYLIDKSVAEREKNAVVNTKGHTKANPRIKR